MIADLPELGSLDPRQIAALAGLVPWTRQSGQWCGKSFIGGGRASVRSCLFVATMVAARYNPVLKHFHQRLIGARKAKKVALVAVARKLLTILNAIVRNHKPWQSASYARQSLTTWHKICYVTATDTWLDIDRGMAYHLYTAIIHTASLGNKEYVILEPNTVAAARP